MTERRRISRVLVANRGEIAVRIFRTLRELGIESVAVHSEADEAAFHVAVADFAVPIGPAPARESYLSIDRLLDAARASGADAVHPGYGFLSESAAFADAVSGAGLAFVGPPASAIRAMGSKSEARQLVAAAGVPVVPGYDGVDQEEATFVREAERIGFPLLVKAAAGGGGRGMRIVRNGTELAEALSGARREAEKSFGDGRLLLERYVERPRHVEIQVFGDTRGNVVHLFERDCSVQRRHQKVIEESPAPKLPAPLRERMCAAAVAAAAAVGYVGAGTVEMLHEPGRDEFFFLEMNTRLQVEHPVTELVTGLDLVALQIRVAEGTPIPFRQADVSQRGWSIEARLYAEDPAAGFLPQSGRLLRFEPPIGPGIRVDSGVVSGSEVPVEYDPMLAKVIAFAETRDAARRRLISALERTVVLGVTTNLEYLRDVLADAAFAEGDVHTHLLEERFGGWKPAAPSDEILALAGTLAPSAEGAGSGGAAAGAPDPWTTIGEWGRR